MPTAGTINYLNRLKKHEVSIHSSIQTLRFAALCETKTKWDGIKSSRPLYFEIQPTISGGEARSVLAISALLILAVVVALHHVLPSLNRTCTATPSTVCELCSVKHLQYINKHGWIVLNFSRPAPNLQTVIILYVQLRLTGWLLE